MSKLELLFERAGWSRVGVCHYVRGGIARSWRIHQEAAWLNLLRIFGDVR